MRPRGMDPKKATKNQSFRHSFYYALQGLQTAYQEERNIRSHCLSALIVIILGLFFPLSAIEWALLILVICLVIILELINTIIENVVDFITDDIHPQAKKIKDMAAASVLVTSMLATIIGLIVFGRHIIGWILK